MSRGATGISTIRSGNQTLVRRRVEAAVLIAALLLSTVAVAPSRVAVAKTPNGAGGATWYVAASGANGTGTGCLNADFGPGSNGGAAGAIQAAVNAASTGDTILLCNGTHTLTTTVSLVDASTGLTFRGESTAGTEVSGGNSVRLFDATGKDVTLIGLTLRNGRSAGNGGAVIAANVSVIGAIFTANSSGDGGGAIYASELVAATDATFSHNLAADGGGAIETTTGSVTVTRGVFSDNSSGGQGGGAIHTDGNSKDPLAGAISVSGTTFTQNTSSSPNVGGGAILSYEGSISATDATFTQNVVSSSNTWGGAAIMTRYGSVTVTRSNFSDNIAAGWTGGAIFAGSGVSVDGGTFTRNAQLWPSIGAGGAIYSGAGPVTVTGANFTDNTSGADGGGAIYSGGSVSVTDASFTRNSTTKSSGDGGGAIYAKGWVSVTRAGFTDNTTVAAGGGAIYADGFVAAVDSTFTRNSATKSGDGSLGGGAIFSDSGPVSVARADFTDNTSGGDAGGGAIVSYNGSISATDATFSHNLATGSGAGTLGGGAIQGYKSVTITRGDFSDNASSGAYGGGAVYAEGPLVITDSTFARNSSSAGGAYSGGGGAIYAYYGAVEIVGSTFMGNSTAGPLGGGAIYAYRQTTTTVAVVNSTFVDNTAGSGPGGAISSGLVQVTNGTFVDNTAATGGHISARVPYSISGSLTAGDTIFAGGTCDSASKRAIGTNLTTDASCPGDVTSGTALALLSLDQYGGPTPTVALGKDSVARDATTATGGVCLTSVDQRGELRPYNVKCDIGAFEGPVPGATSAQIYFAGAYWVKASGTTTVPLTALVTPAVAGCTVTFTVSDGTTTRTYVATTDTSTDTTTATLPKGNYTISLLGSGGCDGAAAQGTLGIGSGPSRAGTSGTGDYTVGTALMAFDHSLAVTTEPNRKGGGTTTAASGTLTWTAGTVTAARWRITATVASSTTDGTSAWLREPCPDSVGGPGPLARVTGARAPACGSFIAIGTLEEWTTGTRGKKADWRNPVAVSVTVTVFDGGTSCETVRGKLTCTPNPDWYRLELTPPVTVPGWDPATYGLGTITRLRTGGITVD